MKFYGALVAVSASCVWGASAFAPPASKPAPLGPLFMSSRARNPFVRGTRGRRDLRTLPRGPMDDSRMNTFPTSSDVRGSGAIQTASSNMRNNGAIRTANGRVANRQIVDEIWNTARPVDVQGGSLRTFSFANSDAVQVFMKTNGRPMNANVDLWQGPDNIPQKMGVYIEDAESRPFKAVIATPRGQNTVAIRNTAQMEFPLSAYVEVDRYGELANAINELDMSRPVTIQGGAIKTYSFAPSVASVQVLLNTDGRPLNARIELLQGPNNNKQVIELYADDGRDRPFYAIMDTPGNGNVVRVVNTAPMEFPLYARIEPYLIEEFFDDRVIIDGGNFRERRGFSFGEYGEIPRRERRGFFSGDYAGNSREGRGFLSPGLPR